MLKHKRIYTSKKVFNIIVNSHFKGLAKFSNNSEFIEYGFKNSDYPLIGKDKTGLYWLCVPIVEHVREKVRKPRRET